MIYLDSSALLKLVRAEAETAALREWLTLRHDVPLVTSEVGRVEVLRAARRVGARVQAEARVLLGDLDLVPVDRAVQDLASDIGDPLLRTLDSLHLASAVLLSEHLMAFVAYDHRLAGAAQSEGLAVAAGRAVMAHEPPAIDFPPQARAAPRRPRFLRRLKQVRRT